MFWKLEMHNSCTDIVGRQHPVKFGVHFWLPRNKQSTRKKYIYIPTTPPYISEAELSVMVKFSQFEYR